MWVTNIYLIIRDTPKLKLEDAGFNCRYLMATNTEIHENSHSLNKENSSKKF